MTEIAVVRVKADSLDQLGAAVDQVRPWISSQPGFVGWRQLRSVETPEIVTDIVEWATLADAKAASEAMQSASETAAYAAIMEEVIMFTHAEDAFEAIA